jgi:hypothetical protein
MSGRRAWPLIAAALLWRAPHCRALALDQHYVVAGIAMCQRGAR